MTKPRTQSVSSADAIVFLVDDDRGMVSATSQWLSLSGVKVRAFADPTALMKVVRPGTQCVVVSDIRMPGIDGMELLKLIKARDARIPVILITGHGDIPLAVEAMRMGAFEFVQKPFSPEDLLAIVQRAQTEVSVEAEEPSAEPEQVLEDPQSHSASAEAEETAAGLNAEMDRYECELIKRALARHRGVIPKVLEELDIPRRTLNAKMKKHGIVRSTFR